ncbi:LuxR C-terminal-related transcriptional regulator [Scandinavium sp. NPDC088450]|uniref:LuxR C-terminal-related transcriptional regulator n=1 Tax=Scandinavium sp. NPDC088450 TaxID=3364514 RepID=UPI00384DA251
MLNVLIKDDDVLFVHGMKKYLTEIFASEYHQKISFLPKFNSESVTVADIIIIQLCKGECYTCFSEFKFRSKSIIIGVLGGRTEPIPSLPHCINDIQFIARDTSLEDIRHCIVTAWELHQSVGWELRKKSCGTCRHKILSPQQYRIMTRLYRGEPIPHIAAELAISTKSIFSHKYYMMNKFNLTTDYELVTFLSKFVEKNKRNSEVGGFFNY